MRAVKALIAMAAAAALALPASTHGHALDGQFTSVSITSVSGFDGHAYVYAQVTDSVGTYPAPLGIGHQSPYYAQWRAFPTLSPACPWLWAVYVYDRATNTLLNGMPFGSPGPNLGTTTIFCPTPTVTPVGVSPIAAAQARLDLDLRVRVTPATPLTGTLATVSGRLAASLRDDLNLYLSMAISDWSVDRWVVDFGDGTRLTLRGGAGSISAGHTYVLAGQYWPRVVAFISGHAEAAVYDRWGSPRLIRRTFSVEVGNSALASVSGTPVRFYVPPRVRIAMAPTIEASGVPASPSGFTHVEALRGVLNDLYVRLLVLQDGNVTSGGRRVGSGRTSLMGWRFLGPTTDAPPGVDTPVLAFHGPGEPLRLQWDAPDRLSGIWAQDYSVVLMVYVRTVYSDGHVQTDSLTATITVTVDFAAQAG